MMGFNVALAKKALAKSMNDLQAAVDVIMDLQAQEIKENPPLKTAVTKIISYECTTCTYINPEGKSICEMCGSAAPATAHVKAESEDEASQK